MPSPARRAEGFLLGALQLNRPTYHRISALRREEREIISRSAEPPKLGGDQLLADIAI